MAHCDENAIPVDLHELIRSCGLSTERLLWILGSQALGSGKAVVKRKRASFQHGTVSLISRRKGPDVWVLRYRDAHRTHRSVQLGTVDLLPTKAAAQKKANGIRLSINEECECITIGDLCDRFEKDARPDRASTWRSYQSALKRVRGEWGRTRLDAFLKDVIAIERWLQGLKMVDRKTGAEKKQELSKRSKDHLKGFLHQLIECAMKWGYVDAQRNPVSLAKIRGSNRRVRPLTTISIESYHSLLDRLTGDPEGNMVGVMVQIAMLLGLRRSEILGLKEEDFDFSENTVHIQRSVVGAAEDDTKTEASDETLPVHPDLACVIKGWMKKHPPIEGWLFANPATGRPYWGDSLLRKHLAPAAKSCGLKIGWHSFRHTYRAMLRDSELPLEVQQKLMRHSDISITTKYGGSAPVEKLRPANAVVVEMVRRHPAA